MRTSSKELQEGLVKRMRQWQKIEDASVESTSRIIEATESPFIQLVMEIIKADSQRHHQVQGFIADSFETQAVSLDPEQLAEVWDAIEAHLAIERRMAGYVEETLGALKGRKLVVQEYLLEYLRLDEQKHDALLSALETIKKGMYPYG